MAESTALIETPSGKSAETENFPVGSALLPRALRPHVATFYAFARAIDDIADSPTLDPANKIARLNAFAATLTGQPAGPGLEKAEALRHSLHETGITTQHALDLISAFKQDAIKNRYSNWAELIDYCNRSAAPVGRYLLDLHGEDKRHYPLSNALCNALQIINHLQDCADDYADLDRVYLPLDWMEAARVNVTALAEPHASPGLRQVLYLTTLNISRLLDDARRLPGALKNRRLALESAVIVKIAERLTKRLHREDPLAQPIKLGKAETLWCTLTGISSVLLGRL